MRLIIPEDQLLDGLQAPCLIDDLATTTVDTDLMIRRAEEWARILRQQTFHLGLVDLFRHHPALVSLTVNPRDAVEQAKMTLFATPKVRVDGDDPKAHKKALRSVEADLATLRGKSGTARSVISDVLRNMVNRPPFQVDRDGVEDYLRIALGDDLYQVRRRWIENRVLREELANLPQDAEATPLVRARL